ncbi:CCCH zinc finger protein [Aspergillus sclerotioniger CBS 115572]|uniref:CCCH zinc finger protein n=1 Tax=Aspergillus sclerotioniger CBS 115572 TaxID=1450535 RepID=A0A317VCF3_9EURO|nr:CCCH zinc finger protein [Aspergillus sclerotioniger CBS 115572]PWY71099.1 CCCH zinc finger protein [Aspergillus sclerotioniger CBS 115572]
MTEDQDLMAKISQLAGQINRHKTQRSQSESPYSSEIPSGQHVSRHVPHRGRGWAPYRGRPYARGRHVAPHRHRTLILNNTTTSGTPGSTTPAGTMTDTDGEARSATPNEWVVKHDRHMQLINTSIYDKEAQARTKAIEESRQAKAHKRARVEQARVLNYAQGVGRTYSAGFAAPQVSTTAEPSAEFQVFVNDIPFRVSRGGSKLIRVSGACVQDALVKRTSLQVIDDPNTANATPKKVTVAGVAFVRSKNGNLHRLGAVTSKRKPMAVKKKDALCQRFTTTGTNAFPTIGPGIALIRVLKPLGSCYKGPTCPYTHDPNKVAMCKGFLQTGQCNAGISCDLSHEPSPHRSPACVHFLRGRCSNPECRYAHVRVTPGAPVCRDFAVLGYCEKGAECDERHVHECPDYANDGVCNKKRCRLPHVDRAGQIRKNTASRTDVMIHAEESDASSEEEEYDEIDTDDVDSDDLDEDEQELIAGESDTGEVSQQQDFIRL